jgi:hypothetical protein
MNQPERRVGFCWRNVRCQTLQLASKFIFLSNESQIFVSRQIIHQALVSLELGILLLWPNLFLYNALHQGHLAFFQQPNIQKGLCPNSRYSERAQVKLYLAQVSTKLQDIAGRKK